MITAKPIVENSFWVVEDDGLKIGILRKKENNKFMLSSNGRERYFTKKSELIRVFGKDFLKNLPKATISKSDSKEVNGYPTKTKPYNVTIDVKKKLPLFTKSHDSKSLYCAGHYAIKFNSKGWVKSFCPKLITIERYPYLGPFKTEDELKEALSNVRSD